MPLKFGPGQFKTNLMISLQAPLVSITNPSVSEQTETITLTEDIDDLLIFAGTRDISSLANAGFSGTDAEGDVFRSRISSNFRDIGAVTDFEPWAGTLTLNQRDDWGLGLDATEESMNDLLTTVLHEIGHVLGIGIAPTYDALIVDEGFTGVNTLAVNNGVAVPLNNHDGHVEDGFHDDDVLMDPVTVTGTCKLPGDIELSMLADIGYEIAGYTTQGSTPELTTVGDETVFGTILDDYINGLDGDDRLQGNTGNDTLLGGAGGDIIFGQEGDDFLEGGAGSDFLLGGAGDDTLHAGAGDDSLRVGDGVDNIILGNGMGSDTVYDFEFGLDVLDLSALDDAARAGITVSENDSFHYVSLADGSEIYLLGSVTDSLPSLTLTGEAEQAETLMVKFSGSTDIFGTPLPSVSFYWLRDGVQINGATESSYVLDQQDVDTTISVRVDYAIDGTTYRIDSAATAPIANIKDLPVGAITLTGTPVVGPETSLTLTGGAQGGRLVGAEFNDVIYGGLGNDTLIGGGGDDFLIGGDDTNDLRDLIFGGTGDDTIDGGYGNDELRGDGGNDVIEGGFGTDLLIGGEGNDLLTGSALGDRLFGGEGDDFINGGFGFDRLSGGDGADKFFHLGVENHGSDWIQDYSGSQSDTLVFGDNTATIEQFQVNFALTQDAGEGDVAEAFVIYKPTGQILWALIDRAAQDELNLTIGNTEFDLLG